MDCRKCDTVCHPIIPRATTATNGRRTKQHIQSTGNKKYKIEMVQVRVRSDWSENKQDKLEDRKRKIETGYFRYQVGLKNSEGLVKAQV